MPAVYSFSFLFSFCLFVFLLGPCVTTSQTPPLLFLIFFFFKTTVIFFFSKGKRAVLFAYFFSGVLGGKNLLCFS